MASDPGSWNRYAYVGGDPVNRRDPRGTCWVSDNGNQVEDETVTNQDAMAGYGYHHVDASCGGYSDVTVTDSPSDPEPDPCQGSDAGCGGSGSIATQINNDEGVGGGGDPLWDVMGAAFNNALKELENPECAQAIGQGTLGQTTYTASMVLSLLQAGSVFGSITAAAIPNVILPDGRIGVVGAQTKDSSTVRYPNGMTYDTVQITVNNSAGAFVSGTTEDRTRLLLHELGHAMSFIFGPGTNGFDQTDFEAPGKSGGNDALVAKNCFQ